MPSAEILPRPLEIQTRFLSAFRFSLHSSAPAAGSAPAIASAITASLVSWSWRERAVWEAVSLAGSDPQVSELYRQELLDPPQRFLFGAGPGHACQHLRLRPEALKSIFHNGAQWSGEKYSPPAADLPSARTVSPIAIELWLSGCGLGVLSISLALAPGKGPPLSAQEIQTFNYSFSQRGHRRPASLRLPHSRDDADIWNKLAPEIQRKVPDGPPDFAKLLVQGEKEPWRLGIRSSDPTPLQAFLEPRLGCAGGEFTLDQLRGWLLAPLLQQASVVDLEHQFRIYTAVRLGQEVSLAEPAVRSRLATLLSALAQIEERDHASSLPGEIDVPHAVLNSRHWAAASCMGAAHLALDQGINYDEQRMRRIMDKYFVPWLLAWFQELILQDASQRCAALVHDMQAKGTADLCIPEFDRLRGEILEFDAICFLSRVSVRDALNRWYRLARAGLDVDAAFEDVSRGVTSIDSLCKLHHQQESSDKLQFLAYTLTENVDAIKTTQGKVEWVELFLISVYSVYLVHYIGAHFHFPSGYVGISIIVLSGTSAALAAAKLRPWAHEPHPETAEHPTACEAVVARFMAGIGSLLAPCVRTRVRFLAAIIVLLAAYLGLGFALSDGTSQPH